jgi:23S rRNA pseudouridine1911/1915/1917 synthase
MTKSKGRHRLGFNNSSQKDADISAICCTFAAIMRMNTGYMHEGDYEHFVVQEPKPLLEWLLENVKQSRSKVKATLQGRGVKVDGKTVSQFDYQLQKGMKIAFSKTKRNNEGLKNRFVRIVYEDRWLVVVEKNPGILSMAAGHSTLNVKSILDDYFRKTRQKCTAHVVHRLDRDTSGLMVYAKDMETEQILEHNWHDIVYDRRYVAVLSGEMENDEGTIANWLKDNKAYVTYSSPVDNGGKYAVTHYHVLDRTTEHSLVEFKLETGRKNQIRVHASDMGHPVCGDTKYGNGDDPLHRLCLHAWLLCFTHPITGKSMEFETPVPTPFRQLFKR